MPKFENVHGDVIEVESDAAAADYRARDGFTEIEESKPKRSRKSAEES